jgi:copper transport protein
VGGLAVLAATVLRLARRDVSAPRTAVWRAYSPQAALSSGVLLATGLYEAGRHIPSLDGVTTGSYGKAVLAKVVLFAAAIGLAGVNTLRVNPGLADRIPSLHGRVAPAEERPDRLALTVRIEAALLVVAVLAAGVLTSVPTSREVALATRPAVPHAENVDGLFVTVEAVPDGPGQRRIVVRSNPTILPETAPVLAVDTDVTDPDGRTEQLALTALDGGRFEGAIPASETGRWTIDLRLHRQALPDTVVSTSWQQSATADQLPHSLRTLTGLLAMLILAALAAAGIILRRRRTPPSTPTRPHPTLERSMS